MFMKLARFMCVMVTFTSCAAYAERLSWPQGKHAAIVLTYDDALNSQLEVAVPQLNQARLKGTFFLMAISHRRKCLPGARLPATATNWATILFFTPARERFSRIASTTPRKTTILARCWRRLAS